MITVEQEGVDGHHVDVKEFMDHYTRSNRLKDHQSVLDHLFKNPVKGWNGKWIFFGVSEGGPIATTLTTRYPDEVLATINWAGAGDFSWREDLWQFIQKMDQTLPWYFKVRAYLPSWMPFAIDLYFPKSRAEHEHALDQTIANPTPALKLAGMTYQYHADLLTTYPPIAYDEIKSPFLVVTGEEDPLIDSSDAFVCKAEKARVPITYMRIPHMDHYVRKREDVVQATFLWLEKQL